MRLTPALYPLLNRVLMDPSLPRHPGLEPNDEEGRAALYGLVRALRMPWDTPKEPETDAQKTALCSSELTTLGRWIEEVRLAPASFPHQRYVNPADVHNSSVTPASLLKGTFLTHIGDYALSINSPTSTRLLAEEIAAIYMFQSKGVDIDSQAAINLRTHSLHVLAGLYGRAIACGFLRFIEDAAAKFRQLVLPPSTNLHAHYSEAIKLLSALFHSRSGMQNPFLHDCERLLLAGINQMAHADGYFEDPEERERIRVLVHEVGTYVPSSFDNDRIRNAVKAGCYGGPWELPPLHNQFDYYA